MRTGYSIKQIKDICDKGSSNVAQKDLEGHDGKYPIYGASGFIKNVDFYHQDKEYVGIVKDGSGIGRVAFYPPKSSLIGTLQYIIPKAEYDIRYVGYCLQSLDLASYRQGAAIPHIYFRDYGEREVFVAENIKEQQRIVDILDREFAKIDALKANAEKSLQAAKDLFQATLKKELEPKEGWKTQMIGQICIIKSGNSNANNSPSGSLPFVKVGDMNIEGNEVFITCSSRYVDYESNKKGVFPVGSVIFPKRGGAILTNKKRLTATEICCDLNIMGVFPKYDILTPEYLFAFFQGVDMASIYDGAAIPQINNGDISPLRISFPNVQTDLN